MAAPAVITIERIGISFRALLASAALFSVLFTLVFSLDGPFPLHLSPVVFLVTMILALPVWLLYLWLVLALEDAEGGRFWVILAAGTLIGPAAFGLWGLLRIESGADPQQVWRGDPLLCYLGGLSYNMVFATIVGSMAAAFEGLALRRIHRRS